MKSEVSILEPGLVRVVAAVETEDEAQATYHEIKCAIEQQGSINLLLVGRQSGDDEHLVPRGVRRAYTEVLTQAGVERVAYVSNSVFMRTFVRWATKRSGHRAVKIFDSATEALVWLREN